MFDLTGKIMVITGGTNGIGRGLVEYFAGQGVTVVAVGSSPASAEKVKVELAERSLNIYSYSMNIRNVSEIQPTFDRIVHDLGRIDILVNCAGMGNPIPAVDVTEFDYNTMMDLNVRGTFFCSQAAARHIPHNGSIAIIHNVLSLFLNILSWNDKVQQVAQNSKAERGNITVTERRTAQGLHHADGQELAEQYQGCTG